MLGSFSINPEATCGEQTDKYGKPEECRIPDVPVDAVMREQPVEGQRPDASRQKGEQQGRHQGIQQSYFAWHSDAFHGRC